MSSDGEKRHTHLGSTQRPLLFYHQRRVEQLAQCHRNHCADLGIVWAQHRRMINHAHHRRDLKITWRYVDRRKHAPYRHGIGQYPDLFVRFA
jgi:hypothetical protein